MEKEKNKTRLYIIISLVITIITIVLLQTVIMKVRILFSESHKNEKLYSVAVKENIPLQTNDGNYYRLACLNDSAFIIKKEVAKI